MTFQSKVQRGKTQVLYTYLPGALIDFPTAEIVAKVVAIGSERPILKSEKRILEKIYSIIKSGKYASIDDSFPETPDLSHFRFGEPKTVKCEIYPLVFSSQRDGTVNFFNNLDQLERFIDNQWNRSDRLVQRDLVFITNEGDMERLHPTVDVRNRRIRLVKRGPSQADFHWVDANTGQDLGRLYHIINGQTVNVATPVRAPTAFLPQTITLVNIRDYIETNSEEEKKNLAYLVLAKYLGLLENVDLTIEQCILQLRFSKHINYDEKLTKIASAFGMSLESLSEETKTKLLEIHQETPGEKILAAVNSAKSIAGSMNPIEVYENIYEYVDTAGTKNRRTIDDAIRLSEDPEKQKFMLFKERLNSIGVKSATYIEDVPLVHVAYGFTRGSFQTYETKLKAFSPDLYDKEKIPIYINRLITEGLLLELDKSMILDWLKQNKMLRENIPEKERDLWFLKNVNPSIISPFTGTSEEGFTKEIFHLIHTISHSLIKQIPEQCGIGIDSIGEIIFPSIPAILIFSKESGDFRIGALKDLFENKIYPWIDITAKNIGKCVYDPVCGHGTGVCHSCLLINEVSCSYFNQDLSRHYLTGRHIGKPLSGFWETPMAMLYSANR